MESKKNDLEFAILRLAAIVTISKLLMLAILILIQTGLFSRDSSSLVPNSKKAEKAPQFEREMQPKLDREEMRVRSEEEDMHHVRY